ncbi:hypothetical protein TUSST3_38210 [Streptomyces sp. TUS-ST3]|nr:hypothetical protein TUSST3_38210 [Streptomyces sp. TUS-ST3]
MVTVVRLACRGTGVTDPHPADAVLNRPGRKHSHGPVRPESTVAARAAERAGAALAASVPSRPVAGRLISGGSRVGRRQPQSRRGRLVPDTETDLAIRPPRQERARRA